MTVAELERVLRAANPGVVLLPQRLLRRVIKEDRDLGGIGLQVPHRRTYTINRERLLLLVEREELGIAPSLRLPGTILLLVRPNQEDLDEVGQAAILHRYWRFVFHARVHAILERRIAERRLTASIIDERVRRIGKAEFDEIRLVLEQERFLLPPEDEPTIYVEFTALFLDLRHFAPNLLPTYFPGIEDIAAIGALLAEDIDAANLLAETRPAGAPGPELPATESASEEPALESRGEERYQSLLAKAAKAENVGNLVRAARMHQSAARAITGERSATAQAEVRTALDLLAERLRAALDLDDTVMSQWRVALEPLVEPASRDIWPVEARLLYDIQKVCIDHERPVYAVDVVEWVYSLGGRPIKRLLPGQTDVAMLKHLRSADRRAAVARITEQDRRHLANLLSAAIEHLEETVREKFRPWLAEALHEIGMRPGNLPERVALNKLTEELLDRIVESGYLNMGYLRDAVSRNNLRLPDLTGPGEFFRGDRLIRANRRLPVALDGVYRRGEFYLRWLQRISSLAFGTAIGRILVLYVLLPFGGAFIALEGVQHILNPIAELLAPEQTATAELVLPPALADDQENFEDDPAAEAAAPFEKRKGERFHLATPVATVVLGGILFGLFHVPVFRSLVWRIIVSAGQGIQSAIFGLPSLLLRLAVVRWLLTSRAVLSFTRYLMRPLLTGLVVALAFRLLGLNARATFVAAAAAFLFGCLFFNSRLAREIEEAATDWLALAWQRLSIEFLPGLFHFIMGVFKTLIETLDRFLYAVDEWLRFRAGEGRWSFVWKLILGTAWFLVSYILRVYVNLFLEPQTNPIKHFPVVTVSAKLLLPLAPTLIGLQLPLFAALPSGFARALALFNVALLPGVFGFLAWELKENWRLYRANQPPTLRPDIIGHHGETMRRLLKPGIHSGTIPKLYKRLRRAERHAARPRDRASARKQRAALHHVEQAVRHFTERELVYLLNISRSWGKPSLSVGHVGLGCTSIRVELCCSEFGPANTCIVFELLKGVLAARLVRPGWLEHVEGERRRAIQVAFPGWYKIAAVDVVGDQPFAESPISWQEWVEVWESDQRGEGLPENLLKAVCLLPQPARIENARQPLPNG